MSLLKPYLYSVLTKFSMVSVAVGIIRTKIVRLSILCQRGRLSNQMERLWSPSLGGSVAVSATRTA